MSAVQTISVAVLVLVLLAFDKCLGYPSIKLRREEEPMCKLCGDSCDQCKFGVKMMPSCGLVCAKGPGDICGGVGHEWGICGDGLHCDCYRCLGCSAEGLDCSEMDLNDNCYLGPGHKKLQDFQLA